MEPRTSFSKTQPCWSEEISSNHSKLPAIACNGVWIHRDVTAISPHSWMHSGGSIPNTQGRIQTTLEGPSGQFQGIYNAEKHSKEVWRIVRTLKTCQGPSNNPSKPRKTLMCIATTLGGEFQLYTSISVMGKLCIQCVVVTDRVYFFTGLMGIDGGWSVTYVSLQTSITSNSSVPLSVLTQFCSYHNPPPQWSMTICLSKFFLWMGDKFLKVTGCRFFKTQPAHQELLLWFFVICIIFKHFIMLVS